MDEVHTQLADDFELSGLLDTLSDKLGVDFVRECFERLHELLFHEARVDVAHEAHIELHVVGP